MAVAKKERRGERESGDEEGGEGFSSQTFWTWTRATDSASCLVRRPPVSVHPLLSFCNAATTLSSLCPFRLFETVHLEKMF